MGAFSLLLLLELFLLQAALLLPELGPAVLEPHLQPRRGVFEGGEERSEVVVEVGILGEDVGDTLPSNPLGNLSTSFPNYPSDC
jgi:hypothetical protein